MIYSLDNNREGLKEIYPQVVWKDEHIEAIKELHGGDMMDWLKKHNPKDLGKFLSDIDVNTGKGRIV